MEVYTGAVDAHTVRNMDDDGVTPVCFNSRAGNASIDSKLKGTGVSGFVV